MHPFNDKKKKQKKTNLNSQEKRKKANLTVPHVLLLTPENGCSTLIAGISIFAKTEKKKNNQKQNKHSQIMDGIILKSD